MVVRCATRSALCIHDDRLPGLRPIAPDGPAPHVLGVLAPNDHLCGLDVGAANERDLWLAVLLLVLDFARGRKRHGVGQQQDSVHVLLHRHGEHAGILDGKELRCCYAL